MNRVARSLLCLASVVGAGGCRALDGGEPRPNLVLIVADDLGWADLTAFDPLGRTFYETPRLDRWVSQATRFSQAYANAPNCAPARAALHSGLQYPHQPIYTVGSGARGQAEERGLVPAPNEKDLPLATTTLAEWLSSAGYATWHVGKWHLGDPPDQGPRAHGFDVNVGGNRRGHTRSYFSPYDLLELEDGPEGEYLTDRLADEACRLIGHHGRGRRPFFLHLSFYSPHTPLQAPAAEVARFADRPQDRGHGNATYAAMLASVDRAVGRVLDALAQAGLSEDTVVVFVSDNGGVGGYRAAGIDSPDITSQAPLAGGKGMLAEGGLRVPMVLDWPGRTRPGAVLATPVMLADLYPTLAAAAGLGPVASDGLDLTPLLAGEALATRDLVWHFPGYLEAAHGTWRTTPAAALRRGAHKLLHDFERGTSRLFDLERDPGETRDLAGELPAKATELERALFDWLERHGAPLPEPVG